MCPYYEWDPGKERFVKSINPPNKRVLWVVYRLAKNRDKKALLDFEIKCQKAEPEVYISDYQELRKKLPTIDFDKRNDFKVILALVDNDIAGELSLSRYFDYERNCYVGVVLGLWVLRPYRTAGIGRGLMEFTMERLKKLGVKRIELIVGLKNFAAQEFYRKLGVEIRKVGQGILEL